MALGRVRVVLPHQLRDDRAVLDAEISLGRVGRLDAFHVVRRDASERLSISLDRPGNGRSESRFDLYIAAHSAHFVVSFVWHCAKWETQEGPLSLLEFQAVWDITVQCLI